MPVSREYLEFILDLLKVLGPVNAKRMFGGAGIYHEGVFFGLVADDTLYFKVDDRNRADYEAAGSGPFRPFGSYAMSYYEVPAEVLEDEELLKRWAIRAWGSAVRNRPTRKSKTRKSRVSQ